jgi:hypothetical protein
MTRTRLKKPKGYKDYKALEIMKAGLSGCLYEQSSRFLEIHSKGVSSCTEQQSERKNEID